MGAYRCHVGIQFSFKHMPQNITPALYKISIYDILGALDTVFLSSHTNLRCHQQCTMILFPLQPYSDLSFVFLGNNQAYYVEIIAHCGLICISLIINVKRVFEVFIFEKLSI